MKLLFTINSIIFLPLILIMTLTNTVFGADLGLITPIDLAKENSWIILDCRPAKLYNKNHLSTALLFSWEDFTETDRDGVKYRILPPDELAEKLGKLGISEKSKIVLYGDADKSWGGEGWGAWLFTRLGHQGPVRLLDGGISAWKQAELPMEKGGQREIKKTAYSVDLKSGANITVQELLDHGDQYTIIDVRSSLEWLRGHVPDAIHISWKKFYQGPYRRPLSSKQLKKMFANHGANLDKPVIYYCTGGIRSGYAWLVHELSGLGMAKNFEGGIEAWNKLGSQSLK